MTRRLPAAVILLVLPAAAAAPTKAMIQRSAAAGTRALKLLVVANPTGGQHGVGAHALALLALLESGVPDHDPVAAALARAVREAAVAETKTYHLALMILACDKLGSDADRSLVQSLAVRLLGGQNTDGGWSYQCPADLVDAEEKRRLATLVERQLRAVGRKPPARGAEEPKPPPPTEKPELDPPVRRALERVLQHQGGFAAGAGGSDNSNTQFAMIGLWAARRHGVPAEAALHKVEARFRESQDKDAGGWAYTTTRGSSPAMTCAGLLGLALAHGLKAGEGGGDAGGDEAIKKALLYLGTLVAPTPPGAPVPSHRTDLYFLWSLERVMVAYGLDTVGDRDWYGWGAEAIVATQQPDGSWGGSYGPEVQTALALLFLKQANLARDLSARLKGKVRDPGKVLLRAGGLPGLGPVPIAPPADAGAGGLSRKLADQLVAAGRAEQERLIGRYRDAKGVDYTDALAAALPRLAGEVQTLARDALTERLARMTPATLRGRLADADPEMRRAAALACGTREDRAFVPDLVAAVGDADAKVARAAGVALRHITGKDFGPPAGADAAAHRKAADAWKAWWAKEPR